MSDKDEKLGPDEVYCTSCGEIIKEEAEICPECGVKNKGGSSSKEFDSSGIVGDESGRIISWGAGIFFFVGGLGMLLDSVIAGIIAMLIGAFLIPKTRNKLEEEIDYTFSRGAIIAIVFVAMFVAGTVMPQNAGNANFSFPEGDNVFNSGDSQPSGDPTEPVNTYYNSILGSIANYERAGRQLKSDLDTNSEEFNQFKTYWQNQRNMNRPGITAELGYTELVSKNSTMATVKTVINLKSDGYNYEEEEFQVKLEASNGEWVIAEAKNPYPTS